jgi:hypothetical protein
MVFIETPIFVWWRNGYMNEQDFANLVESIQQAGEIKRGLVTKLGFASYLCPKTQATC